MLPQRIGHATGSRQQFSPSVIGIRHHLRAGNINNTGYITLRIFQIEIFCAIIIDRHGTIDIIGEMHFCIIPAITRRRVVDCGVCQHITAVRICRLYWIPNYRNRTAARIVIYILFVIFFDTVSIRIVFKVNEFITISCISCTAHIV